MPEQDRQGYVAFSLTSQEGGPIALLSSTMRSIVVSVALATVMSAGMMTTASAQWAVIDVGNIAQTMAVVEQMKTQVSQMMQTYSAMTGNRNLGQILNSPQLRSYLPDQWQSIYDQVKSGGLASITSSAQQIGRAEGMTATTAGQQRFNDTMAANKAMAMQAYQATLTRLTNIQALMRQANLTQDPAAKADLQNRLSAENAMIQNEQTRLNLMANLQRIEEKLAQQQSDRDFKTMLMRAQ